MQSQEPTFKSPLRLLAAAIPVALLVACGGGGGGGTTTPATDTGGGGGQSQVTTGVTTLVGTAATGAPLGAAAVTVKCEGASDKTGTTSADGSFSINIAGCSAPLAVQVTGATQTLVAVAAAMTVESGNTARINVTPVSNAVAATLLGGDASVAISDFANQKSKITTSAVNQRNAYFKALLATMLSSAGAASSFEPASSQFAADGSGFDKVLDNLQITSHGTAIDILNESAVVAPDASASPIAVSTTTDFSAAPTALAAISDTATDAATGLAAIRTRLQNCLKDPAATRDAGGLVGYSSACAALNDPATASASFYAISSTYKHNGDVDLRDTLVSGTDMGTGAATVGKAVISRIQSDGNVFASFPITRSDQTVVDLPVVVRKVGANWLIVGNQLDYELLVRASAYRSATFKAASATPTLSDPSAFLDVAIGANAVAGMTVNVKGPGLPTAGVTFHPVVRTPAEPCWAQTAGATACNPWVTGATAAAVKPGSVYSFTVTPAGGGAATTRYVPLEGGYLPTAAELTSLQWATVTAATLGNFSSTAGYTGGALAASWTQPTTGEKATPVSANLFVTPGGGAADRSAAGTVTSGTAASFPAFGTAFAKAVVATVTIGAKTPSGLRVFSENRWEQ